MNARELYAAVEAELIRHGLNDRAWSIDFELVNQRFGPMTCSWRVCVPCDPFSMRAGRQLPDSMKVEAESAEYLLELLKLELAERPFCEPAIKQAEGVYE